MNSNKPQQKVSSAKLATYSRGFGLPNKVLRQSIDKKAKGLVKAQEVKIRTAAVEAARAEILETTASGFLEPENGLERTYKVKQADIVSAVAASAANKIFDLRFSTSQGPYYIDYSRNGKYMLIGGFKSGHLASFDWRNGQLLCEATLINERVYDLKWLHNETMFAVAQSRNAYIYDSTGVEVHALRKHADARHLDFLSYHMLLVSSGTSGVLRYQDMSTGVILNEIRTKLGGTLCMAQNPSNAIEHLGHGNGTVTLWSPNCGSPLVKMLCHRGPLASIALDTSGNYMATAGLDGQFKLWDLRTYTLLNSYYSKAAISSLSFSQKGLLAVTSGSNVAIWKDSYKTKQKSPYIAHMIPGGQMNDSQFCPYDDTLGLGHSLGISSILVPGAGEPNFDSLESNPFETKKQRREAEVRHILTKIQPEMIALDTELIGKIKEDHSIVLEWNRQLGREANATTSEEAAGGKQRSRSSTLRRYLKKGANIVDPKKEAMVQKIQKEKDRKASLRTRQHVKNWSSLNRFEKKDV